jgi:rod shape-determining protein MreC
LNLVRILSEHRPVVVLIALVGASLLSLIRGTEPSVVQRGVVRAIAATAYPFLSAKNRVSGTVSRAYHFVAEYETMQDENRGLSVEVARLKNGVARLAALEGENGRLRGMLNFTRSRPQLTLEPVSVLESYKGMIRIDRGAVNGVRPSMAVITDEGVVGVVTEVADFTSTVATLHHMDCRVGAMVERNRLRTYDGVVHSSGNDLSRICTMEYIDMKEDVRVGDVVVTSPESLFPAGYLVGRVSAVHDGGGSLWKSAEIVPAIDPYKLDEVFLVRRDIEDPSYLAGSRGDFLADTAAAQAAADRAVARGGETPDTRTLQERFAP